MNLLFISQYYSPEIGAGSARITGLAENLVSRGHSVTVVTAFPNYPSGVVPHEYRTRLLAIEVINRVTVVRTWLFASRKKTSSRRLLTYLTFALSAVIGALMAKGPFDALFVSSPPILVGLPAWLASKIRRIPYVFDVRDIWPEIAILLGELRGESLVAKWANGLEKRLYAGAAKVSVVTPGKLNKLLEKGIASEKLFVLSNGVDDDFLSLPANLVTRSELGLDDQDFVVTYAGTIGLAQGVGLLLEVAKRLKNESYLKFLIIGEGVEKQTLMEQATSLGLTSVKFLPLQPKDKVPSLLSISDVAVVLLRNDTLTDSVPSKLYEYLGVGCPVILAARGDSCELLRLANGGVVIEPGNAEQLLDAINHMIQHRSMREQYSASGRRYIRDHYLRSRLAKQLEDELLYLKGKDDDK